MKKHFLRKTRTESATTDRQQRFTVSRHYGEIHKSNIRISGSKTASFFSLLFQPAYAAAVN